MPPAKKSGPIPVDAITHDGSKRANIPTADNSGFVPPEVRAPIPLRYPRDTTLDPQLVWTGKDEQDAEDLVVEAPPLYIQEKIDPRVLIEDLRRSAGRPVDDAPTLFDTFDGVDGWDSVEYYKHAANWSNRMILGDSLQVMASLAERESLRGQVQMIYMDPPYGIDFKSNWQVRTDRRSTTETSEGATREVDQIKAFRDTWERGISSYLAYLRDRCLVARDLLSSSGSFFMQIGDQNVHLVRSVMDEIFGAENFCVTIAVQKTTGSGSPNETPSMLPGTFDEIVWYAKDRSRVRFRPLFRGKGLGLAGASLYTRLRLVSGETRPLSAAEKAGAALPDGARAYGLDNLKSQTGVDKTRYPVTVGDRTYRPDPGVWKTSRDGMDRLIQAERIVATSGANLAYVRYVDDFPASPVGNIWTDTVGQNQFGGAKLYVVQTATKVIARCMLMTTDPGDLVLDPTCGSGTTAYVAEQWGRRWITIDTSRVALALARQRIMGAQYKQYLLTDSPEGAKKEAELGQTAPSAAPTSGNIRKGFVYKRVPHVTLKSIANNPDIVEGMTREQIDAAIAKHADSELLYDQPYEDTSKVRVAGPFTVESLLPYRAVGDDGQAPKSEAASAPDSETSFEQMLLDNLKTAGAQNGRKAERFEFDDIERIPGKYLTARATPREHLDAERVAISIGPRYGTVGSDWIKGAAREAMRGAGHDVLLVLGFAFDPRALDTVEEFKPGTGEFEVQAEHRAGDIRVLLVRMNADLEMGESLLKKSKAANLFTVFGEPDIAPPVWTEEGWVVTIRGFDVYNPLSGEVRAGDEDDIAMWMIDTDYNEESFFVRHAYFLGADPYTRLRKTLKNDINEEAWDSLNSATSRAFSHPETGKIAVKIINHYGDELLSVIELPAPA